MKTIMKILSGISLLALSVSLAVAGCGGGGDSAQGSFALPKQQVVLGMIGDSTMLGMTNYGAGLVPSGNNVPILLQTYLRSQLNSAVSTVNNGVGGSQVMNIINGDMGFCYGNPGRINCNVAQYVAATPAQIIVINWGINDSNAGMETTTVYQNDLTTFITAIKAAGKTPILEEPNPVCASGYTALPSYVAAMRSVATSNNVTLIPQYDVLQTVPDWQSMMSADCVHPLDSLYAIKAQNEESVLLPIVSALVH